MELSKQYRPADVEARIYRYWEEGNFFRASVGVVDKVPFSIVIPPPNITGRLHMGHALNNSLQDVVIRYRRMCGDEACWFPGTDHAGIATQNVVEKELTKEGTSRHELGREAFVARVWEWKARYGSEIIDQLKALGCSCDWSRLRFTLDDGLSEAVREVFVRLYEENLIYRGAYLVNWCPRCGTAISDLEVEHEDLDGALYYIRYPLVDGGHVTIATTRPETMLGDTAVAVNPNDERFGHLVGKTARLPILDRVLPILGAEQVDPQFGTGVLKITPAHDPVDFEIGRAHDLESVNILNIDGTINENGGPFAGMSREQAREAVVARLEEDGLLEKTEPFRHAVGHCMRCSTPIEPLISTQWFVRMRSLADRAIDAVRDGRIEFIPERWSKVYFDWLENIRDWCISRQLWWGHRIPIWYGPDDTAFAGRTPEEAAERARAHYDREVELRQDEDVLDTWFSSWLWPFSVMGWPEKTEDLNTYFPTSFLLTGFDILFFWVSRMVMASLHFTGEVPFRQVYITPLMVDDRGRKMSKSKGNAIDPLELIDEYGADALRLSMAHITGKGRTVRMPWTQLTEARNFLNKIWNMARFVLMHLGEERPDVPTESASRDDQYILARLAEAVGSTAGHLESYAFNLAAEKLYSFIWHDFCDVYLERAKKRLRETPNDGVKGVLHFVLRESMKALHPLTPFITEEVWQALHGEQSSVSVEPYPTPLEPRNVRAVEEVLASCSIIADERAVRAEYRIPSDAEIGIIIKTTDPELKSSLEDQADMMAFLTGSRYVVEGDPSYSPPAGSARYVHDKYEVIAPLEGLVDIDAERSRLAAELAQAEKDFAKAVATLENEGFLKRAPADVVEKERGKRDEFSQKKERLKASLASLGA